MPSLRVLTGPTPDAVFTINHGTTLGRDAASEINLVAPGVSRRHLQFLLDEHEWWVQDLNSANGTFVNGAKVTRQRLRDGDVISMSDVSLRFGAEAPPPPPRSRRPPAPITEPVDTNRMQMLLAAGEDADEEKAAAEDYSFDASGMSYTTAIDVRLAPEQQLKTLQKRLKLMFEVSQALSAATERDELFAKILDKLFEVYPQADSGVIFLGPSVEQLKPTLTRDRGGKKGERPARRPTAISRTIARKVFEQKKALLCHDVSEDARFADAQSIAGMSISAFMVAPLLYREEQVFGFIQVQANRRFSPDDLNVLAALASSAAVFLKNLQLFESVAREVKEREAIHSELRIASRIQAQLLPKTDPSLPWLELAGRMKTAKEVGGDYYDYLQGPTGELYLVIGDVSGKGVPAGLVMVMARSILHSLVARAGATAIDPRAIAIETNRLLKPDIKPGMFLSLLLGRCDAQTKSIRFAGCGHERPLVYRAKTGAVEPLELAGTVLGVLPDNSKHVAEVSVALAPGDQVLLFTDGVTEAMDAAGKQYTPARLMKTFAAHGKLAPADLIRAIERDLDRHATGADQHDDITMIALRRR
jgi:serine phosphatase RsbU (regulator of sigma subunit)